MDHAYHQTLLHPIPVHPHHYFEHEPPYHKRKTRKDPDHAPMTRSGNANPQPPRMAKRKNETPMYVRPYLEDPVWLQPDDDEMEMLYDQELAKQTKSDKKTLPEKPPKHWEHHYLHDLPGDPDLENPDAEHFEQYDDPDMEIDTRQNDFIDKPEYKDLHNHKRNELINNETPMYVRPYLEDPVWLQPDDDEMEMLYDQEFAKQAKLKDGEKTLPQKPPKHWEHHYLHDLPGDPDLENPDAQTFEQYDDPDMEVDTRSNEAPNGFRKTGEACNHNFECISGKCVSFMSKHAVCMPF